MNGRVALIAVLIGCLPGCTSRSPEEQLPTVRLCDEGPALSSCINLGGATRARVVGCDGRPLDADRVERLMFPQRLGLWRPSGARWVCADGLCPLPSVEMECADEAPPAAEIPADRREHVA